MGNKVQENIIKDFQEAKNFSLSVDSTPDLSHTDQLTVVLIYVRVFVGEMAERFLTFILIKSQAGEALASAVLTFLNKCSIDIRKGDNFITMQHINRNAIMVFKCIF
ncbi:hypothetical protein TNCV_1095631 [Trichonephila clavipes]|nr:hypothetical protein TNCV_1095631 [Trichonephila clavipes]